MVEQTNTHIHQGSSIITACTCPAVNPCACPVPVAVPAPSVGHRILVVVNGPRPDAVVSAHGNLSDQVRDALDRAGICQRRVDIDVHTAYTDGSAPLPHNAHHTYTAAVLGGSKYDVTDNAPWMIEMADWIRRHVGKLPILGICFGHQIIAHALGGTVARNPKGWEQGSYLMERHPASRDACDPLANALPRSFPVQLQHGQSVMHLPKGAISFFQTPTDGHQFVRFAPLVYGTQFHPEFCAGTMRTYLSVCPMSNLAAHPRTKEPVDTSLATSIIPRFVELALIARASHVCGATAP